MALTPQMIDYLIITAFEILKALSKNSSGEPITDEDLKLETWEETLAKVKAELKPGA
jgi:hypothetical protein